MLKQISSLKKALESEDKVREEVVLLSRKIVQDSKIVIFGLHRGDNVSVVKMKENMRELRKLVNKVQKHKFTGSYKVAEQEFVEAMMYYYFRKDGTLPGWEDLGCDPEYYLLGVCDFASEIVRTATQLAIDGNVPAVEVIKEIVARIHGELLKLSLHGEMRKKADAVRWSLKSLEDLVFQLKMKR
jgi:translin